MPSVTAEIAQYYVTDKDRVIIEQFTKGSPKYALSFRIAGEATINRLNQSAGAKPHDILEKSIKAPDVNKKDYLQRMLYLVEADVAGTVQEAFDAVAGFVGHWEGGEGNLLGLYLTDYGVAELKDTYGTAIGTVECAAGKRRPYLCLAKCAAEGSPKPLNRDAYKKVLTFNEYFFTGDYDLHEVQYMAGKWQPLIEKTLDYDRFFTGINAALNASTQLKANLKNNPDYNRIQHGPQIGYIAHMLNEELNPSKQTPKAIVIAGSVARPSIPIAFCTDGIWTIIKSAVEYQAYYKAKGWNLKSNWKDETAFNQFKERLNKTFDGKAEIK